MFAFRDRRAKKREFRRLCITRLSAAAEMRGLRYSRLIHGLKLAKIGLDRKSLSELAIHDPETFDAIIAAGRPSWIRPTRAVGRLGLKIHGTNMPELGFLGGRMSCSGWPDRVVSWHGTFAGEARFFQRHADSLRPPGVIIESRAGRP